MLHQSLSKPSFERLFSFVQVKEGEEPMRTAEAKGPEKLKQNANNRTGLSTNWGNKKSLRLRFLSLPQAFTGYDPFAVE